MNTSLASSTLNPDEIPPYIAFPLFIILLMILAILEVRAKRRTFDKLIKETVDARAVRYMKQDMLDVASMYPANFDSQRHKMAMNVHFNTLYGRHKSDTPIYDRLKAIRGPQIFDQMDPAHLVPRTDGRSLKHMTFDTEKLNDLFAQETGPLVKPAEPVIITKENN